MSGLTASFPRRAISCAEPSLTTEAKPSRWWRRSGLQPISRSPRLSERDSRRTAPATPLFPPARLPQRVSNPDTDQRERHAEAEQGRELGAAEQEVGDEDFGADEHQHRGEGVLQIVE